MNFNRRMTPPKDLELNDWFQYDVFPKIKPNRIDRIREEMVWWMNYRLVHEIIMDYLVEEGLYDDSTDQNLKYCHLEEISKLLDKKLNEGNDQLKNIKDSKENKVFKVFKRFKVFKDCKKNEYDEYRVNYYYDTVDEMKEEIRMARDDILAILAEDKRKCCDYVYLSC